MTTRGRFFMDDSNFFGIEKASSTANSHDNQEEVPIVNPNKVDATEENLIKETKQIINGLTRWG